jgi:hypothetical protein
MLKGRLLVPGGVFEVRWKEGEPKKFLQNILKLPKVTAYSCKKCGFVESFIER